MLKSYATSERQRRATDETDADALSRDRGRAEGRDDAEQRREPTQSRGRDKIQNRDERQRRR